MSLESPLYSRHDARVPVALAALAAILVGGWLSVSAALSHPGGAMVSLPRIGWPTANLARSLLPAAKVESVPAGVISAAPFVLHAKSPAERERAIQCLTTAIYYEAALEPEDGQRAVAQVVLNRVRDPNFPKSVCGVVFQGWSQPPGCQFSFTCDGSLARPPMQAYWRPARAIAEQALNGYVMAEVGLATHYHTDYVSPWWKSTVVRIAQVGRHIFYRWPGAAGSPGAFTGRYAGGELALSEAVLTGKVLAPKVAPAVLLAQKVAVPDPTAPGGQTTRLHMVLGATGTAVIAPHPLSSAVRAPPTPEQVAKINELLSRKFPNEPLAALPPTQSAPKATSAVSAPSSPKPSAAQAGAEAETKPIATAPAASGAAS